MSEVTIDQVVAAAFEVHRHLPPGLPKSVYEDALGLELTVRGIPYQVAIETHVNYKGHMLRGKPIDVLVDNDIVVEVLSAPELPDYQRAQFVTYLKSLGLQRGVIINFGKLRLADAIYRVELPY